MVSSLTTIAIFMRERNGLTLVKCINVPSRRRWKQRRHRGVRPLCSSRALRDSSSQVITLWKVTNQYSSWQQIPLFFQVQLCYKMRISNLFLLPSSLKAVDIIIWQTVGIVFFFFFLIQYVDFWICDITIVWVQHNQDTDKADLSRYRV